MSSSIARPHVASLDRPSVSDAMSAGLIRCAPETPLRAVARLMATYKIHAVYVFDFGHEDDESVQVWGLVSDLDVAAAWPVIDERTAGGTAVSPALTISADEPLGRAAALMAQSGSAHLAVLDPLTRRPVGVLSTLDVARAIAGEQGAREVQASA
jgi:CBS domain-containing protein